MGRALKKYDINRDDVVIATKLFGLIPRQKSDGTYDNARELPLEEQENQKYSNQQGLNRKHIFSSVDASLERLGLDYIDLLIIHRFDPETPVKETMKALHDVVMVRMWSACCCPLLIPSAPHRRPARSDTLALPACTHGSSCRCR